MGITGSIRALELTWSKRNGWHPHLHCLWFLDDEPPANEVLDVDGRHEWAFDSRAWFVDRWATMVKAHIGAEHAPDDAIGVSVTAVSPQRENGEVLPRANYLAKLGLELTDPTSAKRSSKAGRSPMQIASDFARLRWVGDAYLWQGYCAAMVGARQLTWSKGLKGRFEIVERSDAEIAEDEEPKASDRIVAHIDGDTWRELRGGRFLAAWLLEQVERGGVPQLRRAIDRATHERREAAKEKPG
jgi:hypothetical protein